MSQVTTTNPDGSSTVKTFDVQNRLTQQDGYDPGGHKTYSNFYTAATGFLYEQDAYDSAGHQTLQITRATDGSSVTTYFNTSGSITEQDTYNTSNQLVTSRKNNSDNTSTLNTFYTSGQLQQQDGFAADGHKTYSNLYDTNGRLTEQDAYDSANLKTLVITHAVDGSSVTTYYNASGGITEQDNYDTSGHLSTSRINNADGSYQANVFFSSGQLHQQDGYDTAGRHSYTNIYDSTGYLAEQDGYDAAGYRNVSIIHSANGAKVQTIYNSTGGIIEQDSFDASGVILSSVVNAGDGSSIHSTFASGKLQEQDGYDSAGHKLYANLYDSTGKLTEQDGFDTSGHQTVKFVYNSDGSKQNTYYNPDGSVYELDIYDTQGKISSSVVNTASGHTNTTFTAGVIHEQDGFNSSNQLAYVNKYDASGNLSEQDTYNPATGQQTRQAIHNADGTSVINKYDASGALSDQETLDTSGRVIIQDTPGGSGKTYFTYVPNPSSGATTINTASLTLTFDDEFNSFTGTVSGTTGTGWATTLAGGQRNYPLTREAQYYSDSSTGVNPFSITGGVLDIHAAPATAGQVPSSAYNWTSGAITTYASFSQEYGYFEIRAELPKGQGLWPAFWMLAADGSYPPELDIMEQLGSDPSSIYMSTHTKSSGGVTSGLSDVLNNLHTDTGFHTYGVDWESDKITYYFDGVAVAQQNTPADMHKAMYMLVNLAVGGQGSWPGAPDGSVTSGDMLVDYVRAYKTAGTVATVNRLSTSGTSDALTGLAGDDYFTVGAGNHAINGGGGTNTMTVDYAFLSGSLKQTSTGWALTSSEGVDTITSLQSIHYSDGYAVLAPVVNFYDPLNRLLYQQGFNSSGNRIWQNYFTTSGVLTEADAFATDGHKTSATLYNSNGSVAEVDGYDATGTYIANLARYNSDGTSIAIGYSAANLIREQDGFDSGGHETYSNLYTNGVLTEADGFDSASHKILIHVYNSGSADNIRYMTSAGVTTEFDTFYSYSQNKLASTDTYPSDGTHTAKTFWTDGTTVKEQDGFDSAGHQTYGNLYDASGNLIEQDGFNSAGQKIQSIVTDPSTQFQVKTTYNTSGAITEQDTLDNTATTVVSATRTSATTFTINSHAANTTVNTITSANDTITGSGASQTFVFHASNGLDTITNFHAGTANGHDVIQIDHTLFATYSALIAATHDSGANCVITIDANNSITLQGVHMASLNSADFHIV